jgi:hypothetical protein
MSSDICKNKDDPTSGCSKDLVEEDAKLTCEKIKNEYDALIAQYNTIEKTATAFSLSEFIKSFGANNKLSSKMQNLIKSVQEQTQDVVTSQTCQTLVNSVQSNEISRSEECSPKSEIIIALKDRPEQLSEYLQSFRIDNVIQMNESEVAQQCVLQSQIATALKMEASVESAALVKFLQKSSDLLANNDADSDICNNISSTMKSCQYIKTNLCCNNEMNSTQQNLIECPVTNVSQKNSKRALQICNLTGSTTVDAGLITKLKSSVSVSLSQTATGTSLMSFVLLLAVIFLGPPLGIGLFSFFLPKEIVVAFFGIICIVIGIVILNMHKPLPEKPEFTNKTRDQPIFAAKDYKPNSSYNPAAQTDIKPIKYGAAKKISLDDKNCLAIDFSITKISDSSDITDDNVGVPVFYNSIKDGYYCEENIDDSKNTYFTSYKPFQSSPLDIYGKLLIAVGAILILMAIYILYANSTKRKI